MNGSLVYFTSPNARVRPSLSFTYFRNHPDLPPVGSKKSNSVLQYLTVVRRRRVPGTYLSGGGTGERGQSAEDETYDKKNPVLHYKLARIFY